MKKHVKIMVDYIESSDMSADYLKDEIKENLSDKLGLFPDDIEVEIYETGN